jgi:SAM-dependent methyltransferase
VAENKREGTTAWHAQSPYDELEEIRLKVAAEAFDRHAAQSTAGRPYCLVDVGCGVGPLRRWLGADRFDITGLELNQEAAALARGNYNRCHVCDVEQAWPVPAGAADGVHAGAVLEHVADWHAPLNSANAALRDGGLLIISTPNLHYWKEVRKLLLGKQPHWLQSMEHLHGYTPRFLRKLIELHGFEVVEIQADRLNLPGFGRASRWGCHRLAAWGSVLIASAMLRRRCRVVDVGWAAKFPDHKPVALRSIEVEGSP